MTWAVLARPARAQHRPLPPQEQEWVNNAIDRGVRYLKENQQKNGTWAKPNGKHAVGYAALPGLTLLECGVPASDPLIQRTAQYIRSKQATLDTTYELSLSILFLDRLGDLKDKPLIQKYALRLVAGQTATGGWGYKCPRLSSKTAEKELMTVLRHLHSPSGGKPGLARNPPDKPGLAQKPPDMPGLAQKPPDRPDMAAKEKKPTDLDRTVPKPGGPALEGTTTSQPPLSEGVARDSAASPKAAPVGSTIDLPNEKADKKDVAKQLPEPNSPPLQPAKPFPKDAKPGAAQANGGKPGEAKPAPADQDEKPFEIPKRLHKLAVVQDPAQQLLVDPRKRSREIYLSTTDNSNTQFAILALWTAQRHDVPLDRTLQLTVRRFVTSQNADGGWNYHYTFGGSGHHESFSSAGAMAGVGLIGLAVGHGLANPEKKEPAGKPVQDPRILNGFAALSRYIGQPTGRMIDLPMQNLYYLWTLERVAVLYNLPLIGDKDWYRWGAEILVANQTREGNWQGGGYPSSHPTIDTCLALLFLKRANFVKDLTAKLPFNPTDLNNDLMRILSPPMPAKAKPPEPVEPVPTPELSEQAPKEEPIAKPLDRAPEPEPEAAPPSQGSGKTKWVVLSFGVFLVLAGGSLYLILAATRRSKAEAMNQRGHKNKTLKGPKQKHSLKSMPSSRNVSG